MLITNWFNWYSINNVNTIQWRFTRVHQKLIEEESREDFVKIWCSDILVDVHWPPLIHRGSRGSRSLGSTFPFSLIWLTPDNLFHPLEFSASPSFHFNQKFRCRSHSIGIIYHFLLHCAAEYSKVFLCQYPNWNMTEGQRYKTLHLANWSKNVKLHGQ